MKRTCLPALLACFAGLPLAPMAIAASKPVTATTQEAAFGIVAIVGEQPISSSDLDERIRFIMATTGLQDTPEVRTRLRPQVLRGMIDETLQTQEAARLGYNVTATEIEQAIASIETQRGRPPGSLKAYLQEKGVALDTLNSQLRAQLGWNKIITRKIRPLVKISEDEIDRARQRLAKQPSSVTQDLTIAVINLPVDKPARENEVRNLAERLSSEIGKGASFEALSTQFGGSGAAQFTVKPAQLDPDVAKRLEKINEGSVTPAFRTPEGYSLIKVYKRTLASSAQPEKEAEIVLKEILLKLKPDAGESDVNLMLEIGQQLAKNPGNCMDKGIAGMQSTEDYEIDVNFRRSLLNDLTPALRGIAQGLSVGEVSNPFASAEGIRMFMLCERVEVPPMLAELDKVNTALMQEKIMLEAQRYLRNLRRDAFIDVRL